MRERRSLVEHPFGTIKAWMGHTHFLMKRLPNVKTEISLHILAYNMKRVMAELTAEQTGQSVETILEDNARDKWFTAQEALEYGFIDHIADRAASVTGGGGVRG